jgi:hypothetical protein
MSSFADFNVGSIKLNNLGEITQLTGEHVITTNKTVTWIDLVSTIENIDEIADVVVSKEDLDNKSLSVTSDAASDIKYPSVKAVKDYVDLKHEDQAQYLNSAIETLQTLQAELQESNQIDATKEDLVNKSTNVVNDAASDIKYPSVKAVKDYVDQVRSSLLIVEGESTASNIIQWTCGSCSMEGLNGILLPSNGKIRRITGLAYGPLGNLDSIQVKLKTYTLNSVTYTEPTLLRTISFQAHPALPILYALETEENVLPSSDCIMLLFEEDLAKDVDSSNISIPSYIRFRLTIEYETHI